MAKSGRRSILRGWRPKGHVGSSPTLCTIDIDSLDERFSLRSATPFSQVRLWEESTKTKKEGDLYMFLDRRNKNKVIIVRESPQDTAIVKDLKTGKKYLVEKKNLIEILVK